MVTEPTTDTPMRRCVGSERFGIPTHEAPIADFPLQPSGRDGLGRMCKPHWTEYTRGLRLASTGAEPKVAAPVPEGKAARAAKPAKAAKAPATPKAPRVRKEAAPKLEPAKVRHAREVIAATEHLAGKEYTDAVASDEVQAALQVLAGTSDGPAIHEELAERFDIAKEAVAEAADECPHHRDTDPATMTPGWTCPYGCGAFVADVETPLGETIDGGTDAIA